MKSKDTVPVEQQTQHLTCQGQEKKKKGCFQKFSALHLLLCNNKLRIFVLPQSPVLVNPGNQCWEESEQGVTTILTKKEKKNQGNASD